LEVDLINRNLDDDYVICLGKSYIEKMTKLSNLSLVLGNNNIGDAGGIGIGESLVNLINLNNLELDLCNNLIDDDGGVKIGESIGNNLVNLTSLNLVLCTN
jgi:hypothetical protein